MTSLELSENEIAEMKSFYQQEYDNTLRRLEHIKSMLGKMYGSEAFTGSGLSKLNLSVEMKKRR